MLKKAKETKTLMHLSAGFLVFLLSIIWFVNALSWSEPGLIPPSIPSWFISAVDVSDIGQSKQGKLSVTTTTFSDYGLTVGDLGIITWGDLYVETGTLRDESYAVTIDQLATEEYVQSRLLKHGTIVMWAGDTIPAGWALCDGNNGTPDLRNKFVYGVNTSYGPSGNGDLKATGGSTSHSHSFCGAVRGYWTGEYWIGGGVCYYNNPDIDDRDEKVGPDNEYHGWEGNVCGGGPGQCQNISRAGAADGSQSITHKTSYSACVTDTTDSASHLPPYYKVAFIMKL